MQVLTKHTVVTRAGLHCNIQYIFIRLEISLKSAALLPELGGRIQNHDTLDQMLTNTIGTLTKYFHCEVFDR